MKKRPRLTWICVLIVATIAAWALRSRGKVSLTFDKWEESENGNVAVLTLKNGTNRSMHVWSVLAVPKNGSYVATSWDGREFTKPTLSQH